MKTISQISGSARDSLVERESESEKESSLKDPRLRVPTGIRFRVSKTSTLELHHSLQWNARKEVCYRRT